MDRRDLLKSILAAPAMTAASAQELSNRVKGLPPLTIKDVKVITTSGGRNYRWVFLKSSPASRASTGSDRRTTTIRRQAVIAALEKHLKPWLIGKDPDRIEDLWQSANFQTYWRNGPVNNKVLGAIDEACGTSKESAPACRCYEMLGGSAHDAVACYDHVGGRTKEQAAESVAKSMESGYRHIRVQYGEGGYGGGGFIRAERGQSRRRRYQGLGVR